MQLHWGAGIAPDLLPPCEYGARAIQECDIGSQFAEEPSSVESLLGPLISHISDELFGGGEGTVELVPFSQGIRSSLCGGGLQIETILVGLVSGPVKCSLGSLVIEGSVQGVDLPGDASISFLSFSSGDGLLSSLVSDGPSTSGGFLGGHGFLGGIKCSLCIGDLSAEIGKIVVAAA